jgi:hypothetical protein
MFLQRPVSLGRLSASPFDERDRRVVTVVDNKNGFVMRIILVKKGPLDFVKVGIRPAARSDHGYEWCESWNRLC